MIFAIVAVALVVAFGIAIFRFRASPSFYDTWTPASTSGTGSVYRLYRAYRTQAIVSVGAVDVIGVALVLNSASGRPGPGWGFTGVWVAAAALGGSLYLLRVPYELELSDDALLWKAPLRSGREPLSHVRAVRSFVLIPGAAVFEFRSRPRLLVLVQPGFREFARDLDRAAPQSSVEVGVWANLADRFGGRNSGYQRRDGISAVVSPPARRCWM